jgi:5-oxopent-3-ene-1,2,5-tricarboxylate decarboxylase/2-hydroxyhepta-2,4-diene-1,7-dioate isomerase
MASLSALAAPRFDVAPFRLSGAIYGALLNHRHSLAALGDAVDAAPYKGAPRGVVLYVKPRNALVAPADGARVDGATAELEVGAALGLVLGRTACAVAEGDALDHLAGYLVVVDFSVPHASFFRPQTRSKARDASCVLGAAVVARAEVNTVDALTLRTFVDGALVQTSSTADQLRSAARLLADVSDFMTLAPGDILLTGLAPGAPRVGAGARVAVEIDGVGRLETRVVRATDGSAR